MRIALTFLIVAVMVLAALAFLANMLKRSSMFYPDRYPVGQWNIDSLAVKPRDVAFRASDGVALHGWIFDARTENPPMLIWFHGNGGNLSHRAGVATEFARRGVSVLLFDYRGYGKSGGSATESGLYLDSLAAWDFAVREIGVPPHRIVPYGESLGGPFAAFVAARRPGARCVVIENSFPSTASIASTIPIYRPFAIFVAGSLTTTRYLNEAKLPVLIMHGRRDQVIPYRLGLQLYEELNTPKQLFTSDRAGHAEIPSEEGERYFEAVLNFISSNGPTG